MRFIRIDNLDAREAEALAQYRASQQASQQPVPATGAARPPSRDVTATEPAAVSYTVQRGDTLRGIAEWFYGDPDHWRIIHAANRPALRDRQALEEGMTLTIPRQGDSKTLA